MDTLTHCVAGGLTPLLFKRAPKRTALVWFGIAAGELPDIDFFFGSGTPEGLMLIHRGLTHSLFLQPFLTLALVVPFFIYLSCGPAPSLPFQPVLRPLGTLVSKAQRGNEDTQKNGYVVSSRSDKSMATGQVLSHTYTQVRGMGVTNSGYASQTHSLGLMCLIALLAQYVHIFLDSVTLFGTQVLLPLSSARVALPGMFIIDFFLLIPIAVLWIAALRATAPGEAYWSNKTRFLARLALAWIIVYPLCNLGVNAVLSTAYAKELHLPREQVSLFTEPFTPFVWKKIVWQGDVCSIETVFPLGNNKNKAHVAHYPVPETALLDRFAKEIPLFALYREFAPTLLLVDVAENAANLHLRETVYSFADARYVSSPKSLAHRLRANSTPFAFEVKMSHGRVAAYRYLDNLEDKNVPWIRL